METQPNYTAPDLARIAVPVAIVQSEHDEFIKREHAEYLAATIPGARFVELRDVSHFAPLQRPRLFNSAILAFAADVLPPNGSHNRCGRAGANRGTEQIGVST